MSLSLLSSFEDYLQEEHAKDYHGTDDDMPDAFDHWLSELQADDFLRLGDEYGEAIKAHLIKNASLPTTPKAETPGSVGPKL